MFPSNVEDRPYWKAIIYTALLKNVLVSLPTRLDRALTAAVVMYNFYRCAARLGAVKLLLQMVPEWLHSLCGADA